MPEPTRHAPVRVPEDRTAYLVALGVLLSFTLVASAAGCLWMLARLGGFLSHCM
jgi:hypothetical protein